MSNCCGKTAGVYPLQLIIPLVGLGIAGVMHLVLHHTRRGKTLLAVVQNPDAARLMGINVHRTVAISFALSTALAGLAGILIAPLFSVSSEMGTLFGIKAFAVAILGGMGSAWGVVIAGLAYGLIEGFNADELAARQAVALAQARVPIAPA